MNKYKINKGFIIQKLDGKTVIFDGEKSLLLTFNETASYIFSLIKKGKEGEEITALLVRKYGIKEKKAKKDVRELISQLQKMKIIYKQ